MTYTDKLKVLYESFCRFRELSDEEVRSMFRGEYDITSFHRCAIALPYTLGESVKYKRYKSTGMNYMYIDEEYGTFGIHDHDGEATNNNYLGDNSCILVAHDTGEMSIDYVRGRGPVNDRYVFKHFSTDVDGRYAYEKKQDLELDIHDDAQYFQLSLVHKLPPLSTLHEFHNMMMCLHEEMEHVKVMNITMDFFSQDLGTIIL